MRLYPARQCCIPGEAVHHYTVPNLHPRKSCASLLTAHRLPDKRPPCTRILIPSLFGCAVTQLHAISTLLIKWLCTVVAYCMTYAALRVQFAAADQDMKTTPSATTRDCQDFCCVVVMTRELHPVGNITFVIQTTSQKNESKVIICPIYIWLPPSSPKKSRFSNSILLQHTTGREKKDITV